VLGVVTLWVPLYRLEGGVKAFTALVSAGTAVMLVRILPHALNLPGPARFTHEIEERRRAEEEVKSLNEELEWRVTERTRELTEANARLAELADTLDKAQTIVQKLDGTILFWNSGAESLYGWTKSEALGRLSHELLETEFPVPFGEIQAHLLRDGSWKGEFRQHCRDGSAIWVASYWALHFNGKGRPPSVVKINNDITALKISEEALRLSEATARSLFENAGQGILTVGDDGRIVDANAIAEGLFRYQRGEMVGLPVETLLPEARGVRHAAHRSAYVLNPHTRAMGLGIDLVARRRDGSEFAVEISLSHIADAGHWRAKTGGLTVAFVSDISVRIEASREREVLIGRLEAALAEKTVLLKEVHHRVKNNLAVIAGLLGMQSDGMDNDLARTALAESQQRVLSMALIHEFLYATENLDRVDFGEYVSQLATELFAGYSIEPGRIVLDIDAEQIDLSIHRAIPCGLILNELLSNSLKYAFPNGGIGRITIRFGRAATGELSMSCQDDGIGMPKGVDWRRRQSLGLRIIGILAKQIGGTIELEPGGAGTRFELRFPDAAISRA
jgi:PAS domain S-box-containing protein